MFKKISAVGMVLTLILSSGGMTALAEVEQDGQIVENDSATFEGIDTEDSYGAIASAFDGASASITVTDDVSVNFEGGPPCEDYGSSVAGVKSVAYDDGKASVNVGGDVNVNTSVDSGTICAGVYALGDNASAEATVNGDVNVKNNVDFSEDENVTVGVGAYSNYYESSGDNMTAEATVKGNVNAETVYEDVNGVQTIAISNENAASSDVNIEGNINVYSSYGMATGVDAQALGPKADSTIIVNGDVTAESTDYWAYGIAADNGYGGNINITLDKNLTAKGENANGIYIDSTETESGRISIHVGGDVKSSEDGIVMVMDSGTVDVVIEGTLTASADPIAIATDKNDLSENFNITVWKIETDDDKPIVTHSNLMADDPFVSDETGKAVEKNINYIIRIDETQKSNISLSNTRTINNLDTAREDETVYVKLNIPEGYRLLGAYSDAERNVSLRWTSANGYFLSVPRGGGVTVCLSLSEIEGYNDNDSGDDGNNINRSNYIGNVPITTLSDDDYKFDEITGALTISIPSGTSAFNLDSSVILAFITKGMKTLCLEIAGGPKYNIPVENLQDLLQTGNVLTFVLGDNKVDIFIGKILAKTFTPETGI